MVKDTHAILVNLIDVKIAVIKNRDAKKLVLKSIFYNYYQRIRELNVTFAKEMCLIKRHLDVGYAIMIFVKNVANEMIIIINNNNNF